MNLSADDSNMTEKIYKAPHLPAFGMKWAGLPAYPRNSPLWAQSGLTILEGRPPISRSTSKKATVSSSA